MSTRRVASLTTRAAALALALALVCVGAPATVRASGYAINDHGARALAQGLAAVATLDSPETLFYNPAGMTTLSGWSLSAGVTHLSLDVASTPLATGLEVESARDAFDVPHLYVSRGLATRADGSPGRWAFGLSINAPFGLATEWPADYEGRFISRVADLQTVQAAALAAVRLPRGWSLGFGPTWTTGKVNLVRDVDLSIFRRGHSAEADLRGDGSAWGYRLGARWQGASGWRFGLAFHGQTELTFAGDVDYTIVPLGAFSLDQAIETLFQDGPASTALTLPATAWAGVGHVGARWSFEVAATWTNWSVMDEVIVDLETIEAGGYELVINEFLTPTWHDAWALRAGARRKMNDRWWLAAGLGFDASPVPKRTADPLLPDSDRVLLSAGVTRQTRRLMIDVGLQAVRFEPLDTKGTGNEFESSYDSFALALTATASWRFGK